MAYTPTKGSPMPIVPRGNPVENLIDKADALARAIPADLPIAGQAAAVLDAVDATIHSLDPNGLRASQRNAILDPAIDDCLSGDPARVANGVAVCTTFAQDQPAHPIPWERKARWGPVQAGFPDPKPGGQ